MSNKLPDLISLLYTVKVIPTDIRLFLMEPAYTVRCIGGEFFLEKHEKKFSYINNLRFEAGTMRGDILEVFARLEALTFEFFHLLFFGLDYTHSERFDQVLEFLSHSERVRLLRRWGMMNRNTEGKFQDVARVRNHLAHAWDAGTAPYKKSVLSDPETFTRFQTALIDIFKNLITAYQQQQQHDFEMYIQDLIDRIQSANPQP